MRSFTSNIRRSFSSFRRHQNHRNHNENPKTKPSKKSNNPEPEYTRDTVHHICSLLRYSPWPETQTHLQALKPKLDSFLINKVLKTHPPLQKSWLFFNWAHTHLKPQFKHDKYTFTTMIDIFGEAGQLKSMWHCFDMMVESSVEVDHVVMTSVMNWVAKRGDFDKAVEVWEEMKMKGMGLTVVSYTAFIRVLLKFEKVDMAKEVYKEMMEVGIKPNCWTYTVLIEYLAGVGKFEAAFDIMNEMIESGFPPDKATCNILAQKSSIASNTSAIRQVLQYMKDNSIVLRRPVFLQAAEAFKSYSEIDHLLREVNPHLAFEGIAKEPNSEPAIYEIGYIIDRELIFNLLARSNFLAVDHMLNGMISNGTIIDSELLSIVIEINVANYRTSVALLAFQYCKDTNIKLNKSSYLSLIGMFIRTKSFEIVIEIVEEMIEIGISLGTYLVSILIHQLGRAGLSSLAEKVFNYLPNEHNIATYTSLISAYFQVGNVDKGLELYSKMRRQGFGVSYGTYEVLILGLRGAGRNSDAEIYRKEKKRLRWHDFSPNGLSVEESMCNWLFDNSGVNIYNMVTEIA